MALIVSSAFCLLSGSKMLGKRLVSMVLSAPDGPILIKVGLPPENDHYALV
jgi:hypothetical protein